MNQLKLEEKNLPGLYQSADTASLQAQRRYFLSLGSYAILLIIAAFVSYQWPQGKVAALVSAALFLITLLLLIYLNTQKPDSTWYNGRAVAESVKTRAWRWCMGAEPYDIDREYELVSQDFIGDLRTILEQNKKLASTFTNEAARKAPISDTMREIRSKTLPERLDFYHTQRIDDQSSWYLRKAQFNKDRASTWFITAIVLHAFAIAALLFRIQVPTLSLPIEVFATAAGLALTWLQAKRHSELSSSYALTAHEISLIKEEGAAERITSEEAFSTFVLNSEAAFSREHTQWFARKSND